SYFFYACWDYRFLFLLIFSTLLDYYTGLKIHNSKGRKTRRFWLLTSVIINLGFLGFFKYYNFFIDSFVQGMHLLGLNANVWTLNVILPVGISFYTFHGMSYVFDIYNRRITPRTNFINYSVFVSYFPLLVAGPIERATHLLPQVEKPRKFEYAKAVDGMRQVLWGFFKKIVIADNCAIYVDQIFNNYGDQSGSTLVLGAVLFAFQIYGDFSGYSDIALGTSRLLGIELLRNFAFPYFSRDIAEFWRRWHISLSSWFKDYLYIPLGGSRGGIKMVIRNTFIIFLVSGFWHGANWTFIVWGALNALYFLPLLLLKRNRNNIEIVAQGKIIPSFKELSAILATFTLTVFAWIFFRSDSVSDAFYYVEGIFSSSLFSFPQIISSDIVPLLICLILFTVVEWLQRSKQHALQIDGIFPHRIIRWNIYLLLFFIIFYIGNFGHYAFIYFQF
ncbi:MAG: MBOAT family protein, partial [Flavobacteriales bacterium]|nr:MBOAT family protein [Flavobacteriales bacterium]